MPEILKIGFAVPLAKPTLGGNELKYVTDCIERNALSGGVGDYVERFERAFAAYVGSKHAVACNSGTAALHLALLALGVKAGNRVIVPALTYIATVNAVRYCGAEPVFVDVNPRTWCLDAQAMMKAFSESGAKAVIPVHLYGSTADVVYPLDGFAVEDAAEALGSRIGEQHVGTFGQLGTFSFYGNKTITTGEGGMVVTDSPELDRLIRLYRGQGQDVARCYWHPVVGYNYRMPNINAALGLAQLEQVDSFVRQRQNVAALYRFFVSGVFETQLMSRDAACWMFSVLVPAEVNRDQVREFMAEDGIETRPVFILLPFQPSYSTCSSEETRDRFPVSYDIAKRGVNLPTWVGMTEETVRTVVDSLKRAVERAS